MSPQIVTKQKTETKTTVVLLTLGMIAAFFVGLNFVVALSSIQRSIKTDVKKVETITNTPLSTLDIEQAQISVDLPTEQTSPIDQVTFYGYTLEGSRLHTFGTYPFFPTMGYQDGAMTAREQSLFIDIASRDNTHQGLVITIWTPLEGLGINDNSPIFGIKTASAIVVPTSIKTVICIPAKTSTVGEAKYYIDENGNSYFDANLTRRVNVEDCNRYATRTFAPNDITDISLSPQPNTIEHLQMNFAKSWETILGTYDFQTHSYLDGEEDLIKNGAPLAVLGGNPLDEEMTIPTMSIIVEWENAGVPKHLCFPETTLTPEGSDRTFTYFYDYNGNPFADIFLTTPVDCSVPEIIPSCEDTDGGVYEFIFGTVSGIGYDGQEYSEDDYCVDDWIMERWCVPEYNYATASLIRCENGCAEGACIEIAPTCIDNDPGAFPPLTKGNIHQSGAVTGLNSNGQEFTYSDWCAGNDIQMFEYYCYDTPSGDGQIPGQTGYNCQSGCVDGACLETDYPTCLDNQPDPDIYTQGWTQGADTNGDFYRYEDECSSSSLQVSKFWCYDNPDGDGQVRGQQVFDCPSGECVDGACI